MAELVAAACGSSGGDAKAGAWTTAKLLTEVSVAPASAPWPATEPGQP